MKILEQLGKRVLTERLADEERRDLLQQYIKIKNMDWIKLENQKPNESQVVWVDHCGTSVIKAIFIGDKFLYPANEDGSEVKPMPKKWATEDVVY